MKLSIIAAVGKNYELGKNNDLIWRIPEDLKFFRKKTWGKVIVMGRNTYTSLPNILVNRRYVILTNTADNYPINSLIFVDIHKLVDYLKTLDDEIFVIGGASVYAQLLPYTKVMYLTEIDDEDKDADVFFPTFDLTEWGREILSEESIVINGKNISYKHVKYERK